MNPFFEYLIKSTISLSLLYLLFKAFMKNDKTLILNRFLLLGILFISAIIPLLNFQFFQTEVPVKQVDLIREFVSVPMTFSPEFPTAATSVSEPIRTEINYWLLFYGGAILILIIRLLVSVGKVLQLIRNAEKQKLQNIVLAVVKEMIQPFTFLNHVVLSEKDLNENKNSIVAHEQAHIKQLHAIDLAVCEVFTLLHFFNPLMWLLRRDLKLIHEYQADQAVLNKGIDAQQYQLLVLQKAVGERRFALANSFSQKPILKRIKMMKKKKMKHWSGLKLIMFIPLIAFLLFAFNSESEKMPEIINPTENIIPITQNTHNQNQNERSGFNIEIKEEGNFIDDQNLTLDEIAKRAKAWQKTGREDLLLILDESIPIKRVDEVREALRNAKVYHVNQKSVNSDEIIYPAGDVTKLAEFSQGKFGVWMQEKLKPYLKDIPEDQDYWIFIGFIIDKNGKVSNGHVIGGDHPEINEAHNKVLSDIPDWTPAKKGNKTMSVYHTLMSIKRNQTTEVEK